MDSSSRRRVACVAWSSSTTRADELAEALGGESRRFGNFGMRSRRSAPLRYLLNTPRTIAWLVRHHPCAVLVQNPPPVLGLLVALWCRLAGARFGLDSHPGAFGRKGVSPLVSMIPLHRRLARSAQVVLVPSEALAAEVRVWGGRPVVVHEPPPDPLPFRAPGHNGTRPTVLFVCTFANDDPVAEAIDAAARVPQARMLVTGDLDRADGRLPATLPANVELVGLLDTEHFGETLRDADVVLGLTTEPDSALRCGYEAVYAEVPLVCSDWPLLREVFPGAVHVANTSDGIGAGLERALVELDDLRGRAHAEREAAQDRWSTQLTNLRHALLGRSGDVR